MTDEQGIPSASTRSANAQAAPSRIFHFTAAARTLAAVISLTQLDVTATAVALPSIRAELGLSAAGAAWVVDAYSLTSAALADRDGRRCALLVANLGVVLASLLCCLAWDGSSLLAAWALRGATAAFVTTGGLARLSGAYPEPAAHAFAAVGSVSGGVMALGPLLVLGGLIATTAGWRWIFLLNLTICALASVLVPRVVAQAHDPDTASNPASHSPSWSHCEGASFQADTGDRQPELAQEADQYHRLARHLGPAHDFADRIQHAQAAQFQRHINPSMMLHRSLLMAGPEPLGPARHAITLKESRSRKQPRCQPTMAPADVLIPLQHI